MRAAVFRKFGPPSVLEVVADWPKPQRKAGELLVKVEWVARMDDCVQPASWPLEAPRSCQR